jgi:hypothetical protein
MSNSNIFLIFWDGHLLIETFGIKIEHTRVCRIEFSIHYLTNLNTGRTPIPQKADRLDFIILSLRIKSVNKEVLILINAHVHIISGLIALSRISAGVVYHDSIQFNFCFSGWQFIVLYDLICQIRNVNASIALPTDVKIIFFKIWKLVEKLNQSSIIVLCSCSIITFYSPLWFTKSNPSRRWNVEQISFQIPSILVNLKSSRTLFENKWPILIHHSQQAGTSRPAVEPKNQRVIIGIALRVKQYIMELSSGKVEHSYITNYLPEYHLC